MRSVSRISTDIVLPEITTVKSREFQGLLVTVLGKLMNILTIPEKKY